MATLLIQELNGSTLEVVIDVDIALGRRQMFMSGEIHNDLGRHARVRQSCDEVAASAVG